MQPIIISIQFIISDAIAESEKSRKEQREIGITHYPQWGSLVGKSNI